ERGTVLARLDDAFYAAQVEQARADLGLAQANVRRDAAGVVQARVKLEQAERDWDRAQRLGLSGAMARAEYETVRATYEAARPALAVAEAVLAQARQAEAKSRAALKMAQTNLGY